MFSLFHRLTHSRHHQLKVRMDGRMDLWMMDQWADTFIRWHWNGWTGARRVGDVVDVLHGMVQ